MGDDERGDEGPGEGAFRARLRRLRRELPAESPESPGSPGSPEETEPEPEPASAAEGLPRWFLERRPAREAAHDSSALELDIPCTTGEPQDLTPELGAHGETVARSERFEAAHRHGGWTLDEVSQADPADFTLLTGDAALGELDLARAVYLDTETTGLSGGAGTTVFMIGLGTFEGDFASGARFALWQGFLREPAEERALLELCAERIRASSGVVSFFGKSFDRHRLEDKMRLHGVAPPFDELPHLDLYHPLRRLYAGAFEDTKLKTLERELCGVERTDDLSGAHAPAAWFDFLAGRPHRLEHVFRHNRDDVLSLATLAAHLGRSRAGECADGRALSGDPALRSLGLARAMAGSGARDRAIELLSGLPERSREHELVLADALRLERRPAEALEVYRALVATGAAAAGDDAHTVHALAQMAKLLEHHAKDRAAALECCRIARGLLARGELHVGASLARDLVRREERLSGR